MDRLRRKRRVLGRPALQSAVNRDRQPTRQTTDVRGKRSGRRAEQPAGRLPRANLRRPQRDAPPHCNPALHNRPGRPTRCRLAARAEDTGASIAPARAESPRYILPAAAIGLLPKAAGGTSASGWGGPTRPTLAAAAAPGSSPGWLARSKRTTPSLRGAEGGRIDGWVDPRPSAPAQGSAAAVDQAELPARMR